MRLDEMTREQYLRWQMECFCSDCDFCEDCNDYEPYGDTWAHRPGWTCEADLDPEDLGCRRHDEYEEMREELEEIERGNEDEEAV